MEFIKTFFIFIVLSFFLSPIGGVIYLLFKFFGKGKQQQIIIVQQPNGTMQQLDQTPPAQPLRWKRIWIAVAVFFGLLINYYFVMEKMN